jgi:bifunctional DNA-binding transcriptional regulator/antitoxin component of YhaV-PrlF toxin-antitoxin module
MERNNRTREVCYARETSEGQVTIPADLRLKWGITPEVEVEFEDGARGR